MKLAALRIKSGESQLELARAIGTTQGMVSEYEAGRHVPGVRVAGKLAAHYGVTIEELFGGGTK